MRLIKLTDAKETGGNLPSQFQLGEHVQANIGSYTGDGELWFGGWIVGIHYTISQVHYDIAVQIGNSEYCQVIKDARSFMRRTSDGAETNFIDISKIDFDSLGLEGD